MPSHACVGVSWAPVPPPPPRAITKFWRRSATAGGRLSYGGKVRHLRGGRQVPAELLVRVLPQGGDGNLPFGEEDVIHPHPARYGARRPGGSS